jgi:hypothetical protein
MRTVQVLMQILRAHREHDGKQHEELGGLSEQLMPWWLAMTSDLVFFQNSIAYSADELMASITYSRPLGLAHLRLIHKCLPSVQRCVVMTDFSFRK